MNSSNNRSFSYYIALFFIIIGLITALIGLLGLLFAYNVHNAGASLIAFVAHIVLWVGIALLGIGVLMMTRNKSSRHKGSDGTNS